MEVSQLYSTELRGTSKNPTFAKRHTDNAIALTGFYEFLVSSKRISATDARDQPSLPSGHIYINHHENSSHKMKPCLLDYIGTIISKWEFLHSLGTPAQFTWPSPNDRFRETPKITRRTRRGPTPTKLSGRRVAVNGVGSGRPPEWPPLGPPGPGWGQPWGGRDFAAGGECRGLWGAVGLLARPDRS